MKEILQLGRVVFTRMRRPWRSSAILLLGAVAQVASVVAVPVLSGHLIDALALGHGVAFRNLLIELLGLAALQVVLGAFVSYFAAVKEESVGHALRSDVAKHFLTAGSPRAVSPVGDVVSRVVNDTQPVKAAVTGVFLQPAVDLLTAVVAAVVLVRASVSIGVAVLAILPMSVLLTHRLSRSLEALSTRGRGALGEMVQAMGSWLGRKLWVHVLSLLPVAAEALESRSAKVYGLARNAATTRARISLVNGVVLALPSVLTLALGGHLVLEGELSVGSLFTLIGLGGLLTPPVNRLVGVMTVGIPTLLPCYRRLAGLLDGSPQLAPVVDRVDAPSEIAADGVRVPLGDQRVLSIPSFRASRGEIVALEGPNGGGKTTWLMALAGAVPLHAGEAAVVTGSTRRRLGPHDIAFAGSEPVVFDGTLMENLSLFRPDAVVAGRLVEWIAPAERLAALEGWRTGDQLVASLSKGELQKLSICRAIASGRPILFLDEPSIGLDAEAVARLAELLQEAKRRGPVVIATHDPMLLALSDRVYSFAALGPNVVVSERPAGPPARRFLGAQSVAD